MLLTTSQASGQRIIDVALAAGFSDISHFNRMFRRRFGEVPTGVRDRAVSRN
jgi:AraC-like DNA-binding protein